MNKKDKPRRAEETKLAKLEKQDKKCQFSDHPNHHGYLKRRILMKQFFQNIDVEMPYISARATFDHMLVIEELLPTFKYSQIDRKLEACVPLRLKSTLPLPEQVTSLSQVVTDVTIVLSQLKQNAEPSDACKIEEIVEVGSHAMGTMIRGKMMVDIVIILKTLPVLAGLSAISNRIQEELHQINTESHYFVSSYEGSIIVSSVTEEDIGVRILIAVTKDKFKLMTKGRHIRKRIIQRHLAAIEHKNWFEINASNTETVQLIVLFKDLQSRFEMLRVLPPWHVIILAHYARTVTNNSKPFSLHLALKRMICLLACGVMMSYSTTLTDPLNRQTALHKNLTVFAKETITRGAQNVLRLMNYERGFNYVFGFIQLNMNEDPNGCLQFEEGTYLAVKSVLGEPKSFEVEVSSDEEGSQASDFDQDSYFERFNNYNQMQEEFYRRKFDQDEDDENGSIQSNESRNSIYEEQQGDEEDYCYRPYDEEIDDEDYEEYLDANGQKVPYKMNNKIQKVEHNEENVLITNENGHATSEKLALKESNDLNNSEESGECSSTEEESEEEDYEDSQEYDDYLRGLGLDELFVELQDFVKRDENACVLDEYDHNFDLFTVPIHMFERFFPECKSIDRYLKLDEDDVVGRDCLEIGIEQEKVHQDIEIFTANEPESSSDYDDEETEERLQLLGDDFTPSFVPKRYREKDCNYTIKDEDNSDFVANITPLKEYFKDNPSIMVANTSKGAWKMAAVSGGSKESSQKLSLAELEEVYSAVCDGTAKYEREDSHTGEPRIPKDPKLLLRNSGLNKAPKPLNVNSLDTESDDPNILVEGYKKFIPKIGKMQQGHKQDLQLKAYTNGKMNGNGIHMAYNEKQGGRVVVKLSKGFFNSYNSHLPPPDVNNPEAKVSMYDYCPPGMAHIFYGKTIFQKMAEDEGAGENCNPASEDDSDYASTRLPYQPKFGPFYSNSEVLIPEYVAPYAATLPPIHMLPLPDNLSDQGLFRLEPNPLPFSLQPPPPLTTPPKSSKPNQQPPPPLTTPPDLKKRNPSPPPPLTTSPKSNNSDSPSYTPPIPPPKTVKSQSPSYTPPPLAHKLRKTKASLFPPPKLTPKSRKPDPTPRPLFPRSSSSMSTTPPRSPVSARRRDPRKLFKLDSNSDTEE